MITSDLDPPSLPLIQSCYYFPRLCSERFRAVSSCPLADSAIYRKIPKISPSKYKPLQK